MASLSRVRTVFTGVAGSPWYSNLYFAVEGLSTATIRSELANFWNALDSQISSLVQWSVEGQVTVINSTTGTIEEVQAGSNLTGAGGNTGTELPWANQCLVNLHTGSWLAGRELQGRWNLPGFVTGTTQDGVFTEITTDAVLAAVEDFLLDTSPNWVIWSPTHFLFQPVASAVVKAKVAILRSRRD